MVPMIWHLPVTILFSDLHPPNAKVINVMTLTNNIFFIFVFFSVKIAAKLRFLFQTAKCFGGNNDNDRLIKLYCWHIAISEEVKVGTEETVLYDAVLLKF